MSGEVACIKDGRDLYAALDIEGKNDIPICGMFGRGNASHRSALQMQAGTCTYRHDLVLRVHSGYHL